MMTQYPIHTLDLQFQQIPATIAAYLLIGPEGPVLVETGPGSTLPTLLEQLAIVGYQPNDIRHVLVTHIHFDHAGAAGWWAQQGATIYVHHFGARHIIQPEKLIASATRIYGDDMDRLWGAILPAPESQVAPLHNGDLISVNGLTLQAIETPGHARHHHIFKMGQLAFTGDVAGIKLNQLPLVDIPAPPPEFDLEAWEASLDLLLGLQLETIYPTHFGPIHQVNAQLQAVKELAPQCAYFVKQQMDAGLDREALIAAYVQWNGERGKAAGLTDEQIRAYEIANPLYMSVDGIMRYWQKRQMAG